MGVAAVRLAVGVAAVRTGVSAAAVVKLRAAGLDDGVAAA